MAAEDVIMEALQQVLFKQDLILHILLTGKKALPGSMQYATMPCPVCNRIVEHQIDIQKNVVIRKGCTCTTGKQVMSIPLFNLPQPGASNGNPPQPDLGSPPPVEDRPGRKAR